MRTIRNILIILLACIGITFAQGFNHTGGVQYYTIPTNGWYLLEAYGAQGGNAVNWAWGNGSDITYGGNGGYAKGYKYFSKGTSLVIYVGGRGGESGASTDSMAYAYGGGLNGSTGWANPANSSGRWSAAGGSGGWSSVQQSGTNLVLGYGGGGGSFNYNNDGDNYQRYGGSAGGGTYSGVTSWNGIQPGTSDGARSGNGYVSITLVEEEKFNLDLNSILNGSKIYSLGDAATANVYINGNLVCNNCADWCQDYGSGTTYKIDITPKSNYSVVSGGTCQGTIGSSSVECKPVIKQKFAVTINVNNGYSTIRDTKLWSDIYRLPTAPDITGYTFQYYRRTV